LTKYVVFLYACVKNVKNRNINDKKGDKVEKQDS